MKYRIGCMCVVVKNCFEMRVSNHVTANGDITRNTVTGVPCFIRLQAAHWLITYSYLEILLDSDPHPLLSLFYTT